MALTTIPPARRAELVVRHLGNSGQYVVKDTATGGFFHIGEVEAFLLAQLDGKKKVEEVLDKGSTAKQLDQWETKNHGHGRREIRTYLTITDLEGGECNCRKYRHAEAVSGTSLTHLRQIAQLMTKCVRI